jgi:hypothetical protein
MTEDQLLEKAITEGDEIFMARMKQIQEIVDSQLAVASAKLEAAQLKLKLAKEAYDAETFEMYHLSDRATSAVVKEYAHRIGSYVSETQPIPSLVETLARMEAEIIDDVARGLVPVTCASFSELHDYVDANCYGGFCNMEFGQQHGYPSDDNYPQELVDLISEAQAIIDGWIGRGGLSYVSKTQGESK